MLSIITRDVLSKIEEESQRSHAAACESLSALMRFSDQESDDGRPVDRDGEPKDTDEELRPDEKGNGEQGGAETDKRPQSPMRIECLPLSDATDPLRSGRGRSRRGARFNGPRLARAVATGSMAGLFIRNRKNSGGAVCIDASGSMSFDQDSLTALALQAPAATVAYYAGHGEGKDGVFGTLRVFARNGRRSRTCPRKGGANDVDLWAVRWLLRQDGPRVLVSDMGFCGGPRGQDVAALAEVDRAVKSGQLIIAPDVDTAEDVFARLKAGESMDSIGNTDSSANVIARRQARKHRRRGES